MGSYFSKKYIRKVGFGVGLINLSGCLMGRLWQGLTFSGICRMFFGLPSEGLVLECWNTKNKHEVKAEEKSEGEGKG